jgi:hypothetical protein
MSLVWACGSHARKTAYATFLCLFSSSVFIQESTAGGPLRTASGKSVVWHTSQIPYMVSRGGLAAIPEARVQAIVDQAIQIWSGVSTAKISFKFAGQLNDLSSPVLYVKYAAPDQPNVIFLDTNGSVISELAGVSAEATIAGWASPVMNSNGTEIVHFYSLMNGFLLNNEDKFLNTITHELGHAIGLDHAQINSEFAHNRTLGNMGYIPVMYPTISSPYDTSLALKPDDMSWLSKLYPATSFRGAYGMVSGRLVRNDGTPVAGANVILTNTADSTTIRLLRYSCVSDWLKNNDGGFEIAVPPGKYRINIEPIETSFSGVSGVGPYSSSDSDQSFKNAIVSKEFTSTFDVLSGASTDVGTLIAD